MKPGLSCTTSAYSDVDISTSNYITEEVTKSGSLLPLGKNSLLAKIGDQRCDRKCYL